MKTVSTTTQAYDLDNEVTSMTDGDGRVTTFRYDGDGRVAGETWWASASAMTASNVQTFIYEANGNLDNVEDYNGTITNTYNGLGELLGSSDIFGNEISYTYDLAGNQSSATDALGDSVTSTYNNDNMLTGRELTPGMEPVLKVGIGYDGREEMTGVTDYNSSSLSSVQASTSYGYDAAANMTTITLENGSGTTLSYYDYTYDGDDRVTQQSWATTTTGTLSGTSATYGYDAASQLTYDGSTTIATTYSYDGTGNRSGTSGAGDGNKITNDGTYAYTYDHVGNVTEKVSSTLTWAYTYDQQNHLTSALETSSGTTVVYVTYEYDAMGRRAEQTVNGVVTRFMYNSNGNLWSQLSSANAPQVVYLMGDGANQVLGSCQAVGGGSWTATYVQTDNLGSVRDVIASSGTLASVLDHNDYSAYVVQITQTNAAAAGNLGYTGESYDAYTQLVCAGNGTRYYNPSTGTWLSADPTGFGGGQANFYQYVGNGPTNEVDPSGLKIKSGVDLREYFGELKLKHEDIIGIPLKFGDDPLVFNYSSTNKKVPYPEGNLDSEIVAKIIESPILFNVKDVAALKEQVEARKKIVARAKRLSHKSFSSRLMVMELSVDIFRFQAIEHEVNHGQSDHCFGRENTPFSIQA